jgi:CubicO group peptidase (beta-lactamase class C family)
MSIVSFPRTVVGISVLFAVAAPVRAEQPEVSLPGIHAKLQSFVDRGDVAGAVAIVGRKNSIASLDAVGVLSLSSKKPLPKDALFRIASMTKPITAVGVMILVEEGKLAVADPVEKYLPEFKGQWLIAARSADGLTLKKPARPITIHDLLTHTSGLPGGMPVGLSDLYTRRNHTLAEAVMAFSQRPLDFEPGSKWAYCNAGIDTLGRLIEVASGERYEEFLKKRIFDPLGMVDTTFYPSKQQLERTALTYDKKEGKLIPVSDPIIGPPAGALYPVPAGGLYSTAADLAKFYQMMLNKGSLGKAHILSAKSVEEMTRVQTGDLQTGFSAGMGWGLGWGVVRTPTGVTAMLSPGSYGHGGAFGTQAWIDPKQDLFMVLLIQRVGLPNSDESNLRKELQEAAVAAMQK